MLGIDFIKNNIIRLIKDGKVEKAVECYGISPFVVTIFEEVYNNGKLGSNLTELDIVNLYGQGLTYSEIGYLKGITKEGVRYLYNNVEKSDTKDVKKEHRYNRKKIRENILQYEMVDNVNKEGKDKVRKNLGYTERYFDEIYRIVVKNRW